MEFVSHHTPEPSSLFNDLGRDTARQASTAGAESISMQVLPGIPDIAPGDDLAALLLESIERAALVLQDGDILVIAHKVVSKAEGQVRRLADVQPGAKARELGLELNKDPRKVEVILGESSRVVRALKRPGQLEGTLIAEHRLGFICANAAVDESNVGAEETVILLPEDPDRSAREICALLERASGVRLGVVITDTFGRPWRMGLVNVAVGLAKVPRQIDLVGERDAFGRELSVTVPALADELAAASGLLMSKDGKTPAILFRGIDWTPDNSSARDLVRPPQEDLFR
jgi:coenzyme F420-0:L-glutamate ligase / coenzyme F420-1:gamma-L-glutamate ligase